MKEIGLPDVKDLGRGEEGANYDYIANILLANMVSSRSGIKSPFKGSSKIMEDGSQYMLCWVEGPGRNDIVRGSYEYCGAGQEFLEKLKSSSDIAQKAWDLHVKSQGLKIQPYELKEKARLEIIDPIGLGDIAKGKCYICDP